MTEQNSERRRFERVATDKPATLVEHDTRHAATVIDVSLRGLLLELDGDWRPAIGSQVRAHVRLDDESFNIGMDGVVAHVNGSRVGVQCVGIDIDSATRLRRMVELNLGDDQLLDRNLEQLISA
jgi:hypothetical protein